MISITDGQIFLETELFYKARKLAANRQNSSTLTGEATKVESAEVLDHIVVPTVDG